MNVLCTLLTGMLIHTKNNKAINYATHVMLLTWRIFYMYLYVLAAQSLMKVQN